MLHRLQEERGQIGQEQQRIRENLQALGDRTSEKELRERFVRTLTAQEDRLERIAEEITRRTAERDEAREKVSRLVGSLAYEGRK